MIGVAQHLSRAKWVIDTSGERKMEQKERKKNCVILWHNCMRRTINNVISWFRPFVVNNPQLSKLQGSQVLNVDQSPTQRENVNIFFSSAWEIQCVAGVRDKRPQRVTVTLNA